VVLTGQTQATYNYRETIKRMLDNEQVRLIVNLDDLRDYNREYANGCADRSLPAPRLMV
jgi:DNA replication licensing factor MCM3